MYAEFEDPIWALIYTILAMITRFWRIGAANYVVWDEVSLASGLSLCADNQAHFGKFGSHYINRDFYFDVHPPLGKMLVGLTGLLSGYNGGFEFKSGNEYPSDVPYTAMRIMLASFGVALVPLAWWTAGELGWSKFTRHWVTLCVLCGELTLEADPRRAECRYRMALYLPVHPSRFYAVVLHLHHHARTRQVP